MDFSKAAMLFRILVLKVCMFVFTVSWNEDIWCWLVTGWFRRHEPFVLTWYVDWSNDVGGKSRCCENRSVSGDDELRIVVMLDRSL